MALPFGYFPAETYSFEIQLTTALVAGAFALAAIAAVTWTKARAELAGRRFPTTPTQYRPTPASTAPFDRA